MRALTRNRAFVPIAVVGLLAGGVVFAGGAAGLTPRSVRIGMMGNLDAYYNDPMTPILNGVRLAVDQYNATGPRVRITVIAYDTHSTQERAQALTERAITRDKIVGLVGPAFSGEATAAGPLLEKAKVPSISPSASASDLAENGWRYWHRLMGDANAEGKALGKLIGTDLKAQRVFFINDGSWSGWELMKAARRSVRKTAPKTVTSPLWNDVPPDGGFGNGGAATVAKIKKFRPDVVFLGGYSAGAGGLAKRLRAARVTPKFVVGDTAFDPLFAKYAGRKATESTYFGCSCLVDPRGTAGPESKAFATAYEAAYAKPPQMYAAEGYDAATAFIQAVKSGAITRKAINSYLSGISHPGVTKRIAFKRNGEPAPDRTYVYRRRGGTFSFFKHI
jgi:branched-chain amino acid transport system substrate-binding protein